MMTIKESLEDGCSSLVSWTQQHERIGFGKIRV